MGFEWDIILRVLLALAVGGVIGAERELRDKSAGFRTMMFICTGSALFTVLSLRLAAASGLPVTGDPARIAAQIVSGVGFLGAGAILRERGEVHGLTTASTVWMVAALGMGIGAGFLVFSLVSAGIILLALWLFPIIERQLVRVTLYRSYTVTSSASLEKYEDLIAQIRAQGLHVVMTKLTRRGDEMVCRWTVSGSFQRHALLVQALFNDPEVLSLEY